MPARITGAKLAGGLHNVPVLNETPLNETPHGYWPTICFVIGVFCVVAGLVVLLKRRDARINDRHGRTS